MADTRFLKDITGKLPLVDLNKLLEEQGLLGIIPDSVGDYKNKLDKLQKDSIHSYLCNVDKAPSDVDCDTSKGIAQREKDRWVGAVQFDNSPPNLLYVVNGRLEARPVVKTKVKPLALPKGKNKGGRKLRNSSTSKTIAGQGIRANKPKDTYSTKTVTNDRKNDTTNFEKAVNGDSNQSIGTRAILFNADGSITKGADNIRNNSLPNERSSNIPSETLNNGSVPKKVKKARDYKTSFHPNKKKIAGTNDVMGGIAALGGMAGMVALIAVLMPMHFITSAITFLTSVTTMITNVNNVVNTFLTISDSLLSLFGIKNASSGLKGFLSNMVDGIFGKENVQQAKNTFAKCINSIATTTKLLEKVQSMRSGTDNKIDELALQLGTVNNAMGEAGLIPPELMATSKSIDEFVGKRDTEGNELKENIDLLTGEVKDKEEATEQLKKEQEVRDKKREKDDKAIADVTALVDGSGAAEAISKINPADLR